MKPCHHPSHALLIDHAAGGLEASRALIMATHVGACPACARETALGEAVGGAVIETLEPAEMRADALARALARIERPAPAPAPVGDGPVDWIAVPPAVARAACRRRWAAPGVWVAPVDGDRSGVRSYLLRLGPGMSVPRHTHRGAEMVCVLKGAYADGGAIHRAGDFALNEANLVHRPAATRDGECVCLIAADGALIARDWVGRLFQPFVGI